jgi:DNA-binding NarL/FixJ family response regulator
VRVVIAEDSLLLRTGLTTLLRDGGVDVAGECSDAETLLALVDAEQPDAAVIDIRMPPTHTDEGLTAATRIREDHPDVAVLVLSQYVATTYAMRLLREDPGMTGYLLKDRITEPSALFSALERVVAGGCVVDPALVTRLMRRARSASALDTLTDRERDVLALMAEGQSNRSICEILSVSEKTLETHTSHINTKLGLSERSDGNRRVLAVLTYLRGR